MEEALKLLEEIDRVLQLGEGVARVNEAAEVETKALSFLQESLDFDSLLGRRYDKWRKQGYWKNESRDGYALRSHLAPLGILRQFLTDYLEEKDVKAPLKQEFVGTGKVYSGRSALREILSHAKTKIDIQDNYLDPEIFAILEPYFENNANLEARLLTEKVRNAFKSDFALFQKQFGRISAKAHDNAHGRFIILDGNEVFSVGHSLKDIGKKADVISKIEVEATRQEAVKNFENWWNDGKEV